MTKKVNISSISNKIHFVYGDECEKNKVGIIIYENNGVYYFNQDFTKLMSNDEVVALLLRGAVVYKDGKYYRPASFDSESVSFSNGNNIDNVSDTLKYSDIINVVNTENLYSNVKDQRHATSIYGISGVYYTDTYSSTSGRMRVERGKTYSFEIQATWYTKRFFNQWRCFANDGSYLGVGNDGIGYTKPEGITISEVTEKDGHYQQIIALDLNCEVEFIETQIVCDYTDHDISILNSIIPTIRFTEGVDDGEEGTKIKLSLIPDKVTKFNYLKGKKIATAGDSITQGINPSGGFFKNYGELIADRNLMSFKNYGISGSTMSNVEGHNPFCVDRYLNMDSDLDYLLIWFGWNDSAYGTLGVIDDSDDTTFYGAWNKVLPGLIQKYPLCKIGLIVPYGCLEAGPTESFRKAIREIGDKYGIPYLDFNDAKTPLIWLRDDVDETVRQLRRDTFTYDGTHPNQIGYEYMSTCIEAFIRGL